MNRPQGGKCEIGSFEVDESPKVTSVVPAEDASGIRPAANVYAFFSEPMREGSINAKTVKLFKVGDKSVVEATVTYSAETMQATLDPSANLKRSAKYKAVVTTGAQDMVGNSLDQNPSKDGDQKKVWRFRVKN